MITIPIAEGLCPEQINSAADEELTVSAGVLVDPFGRSHLLSSETLVGRERESCHLVVVEASVSRQHARISDESGAWRVEDLGSTNGTYIDGARCRTPAKLSPGQLVVFGDVGFRFYPSLADSITPSREISGSIARTERRLGPLVIRLTEPLRGGGGFVEYDARRVQVGTTQFALLVTLAERRGEDRELPEDVRGFARSIELLSTLPWETAHPKSNHLKQLVRRTRRSLEKLGLAHSSVEARQGLGYRLTVDAARLGPDE